MSPSSNSTGSPKTTTAGFLAILAGLFGLLGQIGVAMQGKQIDVNSGIQSVASITAGAGLIAARDDKKQ